MTASIAGVALGLTLWAGSAQAASTSTPAAAPAQVAESAADVPPATITPAATGLVGSVRPWRLYDSRAVKAFAPGEERSVCDTTGKVPIDAAAVVLNVTAVSPTAPGYLTAWPLGTDAPPPVSALNFATGSVTSNLAVVPVGAVQCMTVRNSSAGNTHVVVDVQGHLTAGPATAAGATETIWASRLLDTRTSRVAIPAHGTLDVQVAGRGGIPATGVGAAWLNATVTGNAAAGWLTAYPAGSARPTAATLNFGAGETRAGLTLAKIGTSGRVSLYNGSVKPIHVVVDASAWVRGGDSSSTLAGLTSVVPARVLDTRAGNPVAAGGTVYVVPPTDTRPAGASAVVLAVTAVNAISAGYLSTHGADAGATATSNVNFVPGRATTNLVVARLDGVTVVRNGSAQPVDVVADVVGWVNAERGVAGRVVDAAGSGVATSNVYAGKLSQYLGRNASDGSYSLPLPLSTTRATVCAQAMNPGGLPAPGYAPGCHRSWADVTGYDLALGQRLTGADIPLEPAGIARGSVTDSAGALVTAGNVTLRRTSDGRAFNGQISNGRWQIGRVGTGDYYIDLWPASSATATPFGLAPEWYPDVQPGPSAAPATMAAAGAQAVTVTAGSTTTVDLVAEGGVKLSGSITSGSQNPLSVDARVTLRRANGTIFASLAPSFGPGTWGRIVHPGTTTVCAKRSAAAAEYCWEGNVAPAQATPVTLSAGQERAGIVITLP